MTAQDVRELALTLRRTTEALVRDRIKFRVGSLVYVPFSPDETVMGFAYPKEERLTLIAAEPEKFHMPIKSDERYNNWVRAWMDALAHDEMTELVVEACALSCRRKSLRRTCTAKGAAENSNP